MPLAYFLIEYLHVFETSQAGPSLGMRFSILSFSVHPFWKCSHRHALRSISWVILNATKLTVNISRHIHHQITNPLVEFMTWTLPPALLAVGTESSLHESLRDTCHLSPYYGRTCLKSNISFSISLSLAIKKNGQFILWCVSFVFVHNRSSQQWGSGPKALRLWVK